MTTRLSAKPAFTLIELLVVISIIALLIGILLPALGAARTTARIAASASNQRQIGIAMAAYQADSKEYFPLWQQDDLGQMVNGNIIWYWTTKLAVDNYIPGLDIYADPSFDGETPFLEEFSFGRAGTSSSVNRDNMDARVFNWIHYGYNYVWVGSNLAESSGTRAAASNRKNIPIYVPARQIDMEDPTSVMVTTGVRDWTPGNKLTDARSRGPVRRSCLYRRPDRDLQRRHPARPVQRQPPERLGRRPCVQPSDALHPGAAGRDGGWLHRPAHQQGGPLRPQRLGQPGDLRRRRPGRPGPG